MLTVLSPAKTLDYETAPITQSATLPRFMDQSALLVEDARGLNPDDIRTLMGVSEQIAHLNHERFMNWQSESTSDNAKQAVLAFKGDVYTGLQAETLSEDDLDFAQTRLRILSGLYGLLRPLDLMQPYRLEMGLKFTNQRGRNLYEFWGEQLTDTLNADLVSAKTDVLINLASNEYFKAIKPKLLNADIITPQFKDLKNGQYKMISFFAKKARGLMARYIIDNRITEPEALKSFSEAGYYYSDEQSQGDQWVFLRDEVPA
ncbi:MAG: peroxide stress protein YaaA [Luminiphilus sp.]|nr:peroxide stress protein YaaA [Luminiphilus sp.]